MPPTAETILIDWGTTNVRAWALDGAGAILDRREAASGIRQVADGDFAGAFDRLVGEWRAERPLPVVMSGMIGSRQGWSEAPYVSCPAGPDDIARRLHRVPGQSRVAIVPGVHLDEDGRHDVMRGEEVQCFGALELSGIADAVLCLPGTHSKWVRMAAGRIVRFATAMTGETYAAMRDHSILGALMAPPAGEAPRVGGGGAFGRGLERSGAPGGLLHHLFSVRADGLFGAVAAEDLADYLSGILIGHEIRAMAQMFRPEGPVLVVGGAGLSHVYGEALEQLGLQFRPVGGEAATIAGLSQVLERAAAR